VVSKPALGKFSSQDPISKIPNTKQSWWSGSSAYLASVEMLSSNPSATDR
jgi:hypothetical protein